ncbi:IS200/IS605 family transposase [Candidatus Woesearchaeota archaeon]|nr:IS200/IS605 family transposase [Candidatus Woesearchaeota archaeon]
MKLNLKATNHGVGQNVYHLVFKPKYARPLFKNLHFRKVCEGAFRLIAFQYDFVIHELQVMPDHVHIFVDLKPYMPVSKALQLLKGVSSRILRRNFSYLREDGQHLWSPGKFYRSVGNVSADVIQNYIKHSQDSWSLPDSKIPTYYHQKHLSAFA